MFQGWDSFYLLIGGAAGALIGLLFVVETLTAGLDRDKAIAGASVYVTPIVFHFAVVLVISALALAPHVASWLQALLIGAAAIVGLVYSAVVMLTLRSGRVIAAEHWTDIWSYGVAPAGGYLALAAAAFGAPAFPAASPFAIAAVVVVLLLVAIRNAWDLVVWLAPGANRG